jgi:transposase
MDTMEPDIIEVRADGRARRRREYSEDFKRRLVMLTLEPGASVSQIAQRHGLNTNLLFTWRRDPKYATQGQFPAAAAAAAMPKLLAVSIAPGVAEAKREPASKQADASAAFIEIEVAASRVRLHGGVDMQMVAGVLRLLERGR